MFRKLVHEIVDTVSYSVNEHLRSFSKQIDEFCNRLDGVTKDIHEVRKDLKYLEQKMNGYVHTVTSDDIRPANLLENPTPVMREYAAKQVYDAVQEAQARSHYLTVDEWKNLKTALQPKKNGKVKNGKRS